VDVQGCRECVTSSVGRYDSVVFSRGIARVVVAQRTSVIKVFATFIAPHVAPKDSAGKQCAGLDCGGAKGAALPAWWSYGLPRVDGAGTGDGMDGRLQADQPKVVFSAGSGFLGPRRPFAAFPVRWGLNGGTSTVRWWWLLLLLLLLL
jgi:hypothetical protein